jgi:hypothetical protein
MHIRRGEGACTAVELQQSSPVMAQLSFFRQGANMLFMCLTLDDLFM